MNEFFRHSILSVSFQVLPILFLSVKLFFIFIILFTFPTNIYGNISPRFRVYTVWDLPKPTYTKVNCQKKKLIEHTCSLLPYYPVDEDEVLQKLHHLLQNSENKLIFEYTVCNSLINGCRPTKGKDTEFNYNIRLPV